MKPKKLTLAKAKEIIAELEAKVKDEASLFSNTIDDLKDQIMAARTRIGKKQFYQGLIWGAAIVTTILVIYKTLT